MRQEVGKGMEDKEEVFVQGAGVMYVGRREKDRI